MIKLVFLVGVVVLCLCVVPAVGQTWETKATIHVPYDFLVGDTLLPAGPYVILTWTESPSILMIKNLVTGASALTGELDIMLAMPAPQSEMRFASDKGVHRLHQVVIQGDNHIHNLVHSATIADLERIH